MAQNTLITGGSGLLAKNWVSARLNKNNILLAEHDAPCLVPNTKSIKIDLSCVDDIILALKSNSIDVCIHAAGLTSVELCELNPQLAEYANVVLTKNVAIACSLLGVPFVFISTDHLFSGKIPMSGEDQAIEPLNVYAATKARAESVAFSEHPNPLVIRTNFFGQGHKFRQSFSDYIVENLISGKSINLFEDVFYTPIIASFLANVTHELIEIGAHGIFNIVGSERLSKYDFGIQLAEIFQLDSQLIVPISIDTLHHLVLRPKDMSLSNEKLINFLGRSPPTLALQLQELKFKMNDPLAI